MKKTVELIKKLNEIGTTSFDETWPNYVAVLKLKKSDAKTLMQIVSKSNLSTITNGCSIDNFAAMHCWRALGQLQSKQSLKVLLNSLIEEKNEEAFWYRIELPYVIKQIGLISIKQLTNFIKKKENRWDDKVIIIKGLVEIALQNIENRGSIVEIINTILKKYKNNNLAYNACILNEIFKLKPYHNALITEIINTDKFDYDFIDRLELDKFIKNAKIYQ
ncbi:MAG: hypothetical protein KAZ71_00515 [Bacteroidia bacterium]|nr:hypothetical protein [Bacteroidia bacterium]